MLKVHFLLLFLIMNLQVPLRAEEVAKPEIAAMPSLVTGSSVLHMFLALLLVLAVIGVIAWLLKRFGIGPGNQSNLIKVVAAAAVGQRERIVIVEIANAWLILGVAPGHINLLHQIEKIASSTGNKQSNTEGTNDFFAQLQKNIKKQQDE